MNKIELVNAIAGKTGFTKKDVTIVVDSVFDTIVDTVVGGEDVKIHGFGNFATSVRGAHEGCNPITRERIEIPEIKNMKFSPSSTVKAAFRG